MTQNEIQMLDEEEVLVEAVEEAVEQVVELNLIPAQMSPVSKVYELEQLNEDREFTVDTPE